MKNNFHISVAEHPWPDRFSISMDEEKNTVTVERTDRNEGWGQDLNLIVKDNSSGKEAVLNIGSSESQRKSSRFSNEIFEKRSYGDDLMRAFRVHRTNSRKIRMGSEHDGGYVVNEAMIGASSRLVSLGIGQEDTFERDYIKIKPNSVVECYDGSCHCGLLCSQNPEKVSKQVYHINKYAGPGRDQVPLNAIVGGKSEVLLKIDIEGGEYSLFDNANLSGVVGVIIELHDLHVPQRMSDSIVIVNQVLKDFTLFHAHANVWGGCFPLTCSDLIIRGFPKVIELSFVRSVLCQDLGLDFGIFPVEGLDSSNDKNREDMAMTWINKK